MTGSRYARTVQRSNFPLLKEKRLLLERLDIELTERCNNKCVHCYINLPKDAHYAEAKEMETEFVIDLLRQAAELGCLAVRFTGGEPLLRRDFAELYLAARRLGIKVVLFTNARLITPDLAQLFLRIPLGYPVEVTVYGMRAGTYDAVAGVKGAYEEFKRGVDILLEFGIPFVVKQPVLPQNRHEMKEFEEWAATIPWMEGRPKYAMNFDLRARRDDEEKNQRIAALRMSPQESAVFLVQDQDNLSSAREFCRKFMGPRGDILFSCGAGHGVSVDSYGKAQMCLLLRHSDTVCDLKKVSMREALTEIFPRIRETRSANPQYLDRCAVCFLKGLCEQCPAKSWMEHGVLDIPVEYLCRVAHAQAGVLGLLKEGESAWEVRDWRERIDLLSD